MKTISLDIKNKEDLEYLESVNYDPDILNTALTIGLKSIQMSQTTMNGNSYIEPLREIIVENNIENSENINEPILPDIVLLGLILVNFFPPIKFPVKYPPVSEKIQIKKRNVRDF